ncbi:hypothetical protein Acr_28g0003660 [Actinidia rufa]|uniref:Uncharacterized protein n=1 Tax=Actinidia rufa TaxID=165716 RepID=A0A7J0H9N1_9ERIC|nr:hypothetical protein Acr_28g0003660 [Actinidia rufa]
MVGEGEVDGVELAIMWWWCGYAVTMVLEDDERDAHQGYCKGTKHTTVLSDRKRVGATPQRGYHPLGLAVSRTKLGVSTITTSLSSGTMLVGSHPLRAETTISTEGDIIKSGYLTLTVGVPFSGNNSGGRSHCCHCAARKRARPTWSIRPVSRGRACRGCLPSIFRFARSKTHHPTSIAVVLTC